MPRGLTGSRRTRPAVGRATARRTGAANTIADAPFSPGLLGLLRGPFRALGHYVEDELAAAGYEGIRRAHFGLLRVAGGEKPCNLTLLAKQTEVTKQSAAYLIDHLEEHGYIESAPDPADDRLRMIKLTARGQKVDREMRTIIERLEKKWAGQVGPRRFAQFRRTLVDLNAVIAKGRSGSRARSR